ncbi:hypothetical protein PhaeoP18_03925 (plasmid) [Phaeobacter piscinae]|nr:hypothetical protein PhaeoP14_03686 [Phaeobacter piscinae]AUR38141.1 hypothetical protein PhaeoP18_03925 [Phaeobacter piscinae]
MSGRIAAVHILYERQHWAGQAPKGEDGSQLCSGGFLRIASLGVERSISRCRHHLLDGRFGELAKMLRTRSEAIAAPDMKVAFGLAGVILRR